MANPQPQQVHAKGGQQPASNAGRVRLEGSLTAGELASARATIIEALNSSDTVTLDCSALTAADIGLVQLILSARKTAFAEGKRLTLGAPAGGALLGVLTCAGFAGATSGIPAEEQAFWLNRESQ